MTLRTKYSHNSVSDVHIHTRPDRWGGHNIFPYYVSNVLHTRLSLHPYCVPYNFRSTSDWLYTDSGSFSHDLTQCGNNAEHATYVATECVPVVLPVLHRGVDPYQSGPATR